MRNCVESPTRLPDTVFDVGSLVAPVWGGTVGDSAMGDDESQKKFLEAVKVGCRIAGVFNDHGVRKRGVIRIDSAEFGVEKWREDPATNTKRVAATFREAAKIAADHGERLAAEGEICWAGMPQLEGHARSPRGSRYARGRSASRLTWPTLTFTFSATTLPSMPSFRTATATKSSTLPTRK